MKLSWVFGILMLSLSTNLYADEVSDECLLSMQKVYKFYYHEIVPKADEGPEQLGSDKANEMETVIGKLKSSCSPEVVAKMNQYLQADDKSSHG